MMNCPPNSNGNQRAKPQQSTGLVAAHARLRWVFRLFGISHAASVKLTCCLQARDIETVQQMAAVAPAKKQADMNGEVVAKLHLVEKHIRKNKLQVTPDSEVGQPMHAQLHGATHVYAHNFRAAPQAFR